MEREVHESLQYPRREKQKWEPYLVREIPDRKTFLTCVTTNCTGSTGGLHDTKTTFPSEISWNDYYRIHSDIPQSVFVGQFADFQKLSDTRRRKTQRNVPNLFSFIGFLNVATSLAIAFSISSTKSSSISGSPSLAVELVSGHISEPSCLEWMIYIQISVEVHLYDRSYLLKQISQLRNRQFLLPSNTSHPNTRSIKRPLAPNRFSILTTSQNQSSA